MHRHAKNYEARTLLLEKWQVYFLGLKIHVVVPSSVISESNNAFALAALKVKEQKETVCVC